MELLNLALTAKRVWRLLMEPKSLWSRILRHKCLAGAEEESILDHPLLPKGSPIWNSMIKCVPLISAHHFW